MGGVADSRRDPVFPAWLVATIVFFCGLLRVRSFNALEPKLVERPFQLLVGKPKDIEDMCSVDTVSRALRATELSSVSAVNRKIIAKAERNKVFREGWHGALRYVAVDGWEPICSYERHCPDCLTRLVKKKLPSGEVEEVVQYYHRYAVAMLIDERFDMALDFEPVLPADRRSGPHKDERHEGELTAAKRLVSRVKRNHPWVDVIVGDSLYANGPFLTLLGRLKLGAVVIIKKEGDEPLKEALDIWKKRPPEKVVEDDESGERIELWDTKDLETLDTYKGKIRAVRGRVTKPKAEGTSTWCMAVTGKAVRLSARQVLAVARGRWHIENTGFHQWTKRWKFTHVFSHHGNGIQALYWLFFVAYNLLTLFIYRQLRCYGRDRGNDVTKTISRLIDEMRDDLARFTSSPWDPG